MSIMMMTLQASVMIGIVLIIRKLLWERLPKLVFPFLWGVVLLRLLIPLAVPSAFSIYNLWKAENQVGMQENILILNGDNPEKNQEQNQEQVTIFFPDNSRWTKLQSIPEDKGKDVWHFFADAFIWKPLWLTGSIVIFCFFLFIYYRNRKAIEPLKSLENDAFIMEWKKQHRLLRSLKILESYHLSTPISYGVFHPKIILPQEFCQQNKAKLHSILIHEFCHIKRWDALWKWLMVLAVSLHWMNPLVWLMMYYFNRDLEVSCDEMVLSQMGVDYRTEYAHSLLEMAQEKNGFSPLYNHFSKNVVKERIVAIMKYQKIRFSLIVAGLLITLTVGILFATSSQPQKQQGEETKESTNRSLFEKRTNTVTNGLSVEEIKQLTSYTKDEMAKLEALLLPDVENMTVLDFRNQIHAMTDTPEYMQLLEKAAADENLYITLENQGLVEYLQYVFYPLTSERWQKQFFNQQIGVDYEEAKEFSLEWTSVLSVTDEKILTIRDYYIGREEVIGEIQKFVSTRKKEELLDTDNIKIAFEKAVSEIEKKWSKDGLAVEILYQISPAVLSQKGNNTEKLREERRFAKGTKEDYQSLLRLKNRYKEKFLVDFNREISEWSNEHEESSERIYTDIIWNDILTGLTAEERDFVQNTFYYSATEIAAINRAKFTGTAMKGPIFDIELQAKTQPDKRTQALIRFSFSYQVFYHMSSHRISVVERDEAVNGFIREVQVFWANMTTEETVRFLEKQEDVDNWLNGLCQKYSSEKIKLEITNQMIQRMNEEQFQK